MFYSYRGNFPQTKPIFSQELVRVCYTFAELLYELPHVYQAIFSGITLSDAQTMRPVKVGLMADDFLSL